MHQFQIGCVRSRQTRGMPGKIMSLERLVTRIFSNCIVHHGEIFAGPGDGIRVFTQIPQMSISRFQSSTKSAESTYPEKAPVAKTGLSGDGMK